MSLPSASLPIRLDSAGWPTAIPDHRLRPHEHPAPGARFLRLFGDVSAGEVRDVLLMFASIFLLLVAYYILKTVREPLILATGGAELKTYAAGAQALCCCSTCRSTAGWRALPRNRAGHRGQPRDSWRCIQLFFVTGLPGRPAVGFAFYVFVGIFSLTLIAQFWSFANDIYAQGGRRSAVPAHRRRRHRRRADRAGDGGRAVLARPQPLGDDGDCRRAAAAAHLALYRLVRRGSSGGGPGAKKSSARAGLRPGA